MYRKQRRQVLQPRCTPRKYAAFPKPYKKGRRPDVALATPWPDHRQTTTGGIKPIFKALDGLTLCFAALPQYGRQSPPHHRSARGDNLFCNHMIWDPNGLCDTYE
jgi:hypothetical protein